jgi:4,5-dihydroxyphthalate decarboxylase
MSGDDSAVTDPAQLAGRTVGVPEYQITAAVWIRGILAEHHGLDVASVRYRTGGLDEPGRVEKLRLDLPPRITVSPIDPGQTLTQLLIDGELDAIYSARNPGPFNTPGGGGIRRLFPDPEAAERSYHARTGIFPIMHTLVIRRSVYEKHRWLARELVKACTAAKALTLSGMGETAALRCATPCPGCGPRSTGPAPPWVRTGGPTGWSATGRPWRRSCATPTNRAWPPRLHEPEELFAPESLAAVVV